MNLYSDHHCNPRAGERFALAAGMAVPILYFGAVLTASLFQPGFSFTGQFASELGAAGARFPYILNAGITLTGLAGFISAFGFWHALKRLGANPVLARMVGYIMAMFGVAIVMAGIFPMPDMRHSGFGLSMPIVIGPALVAIALRERIDATKLRNYLICTNVVAVAMMTIMFCATRSSFVGLIQLLYSLAAVPWIGVAAYALSRLGTGKRVHPDSGHMGKVCS